MRAVGLLLLALTAAASMLAAEETYVIRLTRPRQVGDRYRLDANGVNRERTRVTVGGRTTKNEETEVSVHLVAVATVLAVDAKSVATRIEYRVESCRRTSAGKTDEVLPAGRKIIAETVNGKSTFTADGAQPWTGDTREALNVVITPHEPGSATEDEIFGTAGRKRVGDKWGINAATAALDFSKRGIPVSATGIRGSVQLDRVRTLGAMKALEISARLRVEGMKIPAPEGMALEKAVMEADFTDLVPADPQSRSLLPDKLRFQMNALMSGQKPDTGEKIAFEFSMERSLENSYPPIQEDSKSQSSPNQLPQARDFGNRLSGMPLALNGFATTTGGWR